MRKHYIILIPLILFIFMQGCGLSGENHSQTANVDNIKTIVINHDSTNLFLRSADQQNMEASYSKQDITMDEEDEQITLGIKKDLINIGPKLNMNDKFEVTIPDEFEGNLVINGSSGNVSSDQLSTNNLDIETKSGNISISFEDFHSDVHAVTTSGNIDLLLNEEYPDIQLKSKTVSGDEMINIPISADESQDEKEIEDTAGKGSSEINVTTISGNITVR
ncbi:DUF4097 family beta strand repeat-containing protein [Gracilibacillus sp. S3-1-1]|uniref:DUF4097 family beta strand repeat-containing protein n=1 Tax=Gracilibacillus pellucidus TaxID=3095368 RepID=A0ACC6M8B3_9BACI|nr:DUF4097 family beta strand repeat-containing protein [Gracilibacillus sp. S3-1-1]MDX8047233.1 DUF4097 family beta strand repeat-containing protein [Gracilibacillus sp. S3-1-1]